MRPMLIAVVMTSLAACSSWNDGPFGYRMAIVASARIISTMIIRKRLCISRMRRRYGVRRR
jgi:hypothetical protein